MKRRVEYPVYGLWKVTTEGDCEGRSTKDLGIHEGYFDEIAFALADKAYYSLHFKLLKPEEQLTDMSPKKKRVDVTLDIESGVWDMTVDERREHFRDLLKNRDVTVVTDGGVSFGGILLETNKKVGTVPETPDKLKEAFFNIAAGKNTITTEQKQLLKEYVSKL